MNCPNCKASGKMSVCRSGVAGSSPVFVECVCGWSQAPLDALVIDAAIATWHRANPAPIAKVVEEMQAKVYYSIGLAEGWAFGPRWVIWKHTFSGKSMADNRSWAFAERETAQDALAAFVHAKAAELGELPRWGSVIA